MTECPSWRARQPLAFTRGRFVDCRHRRAPGALWCSMWPAPRTSEAHPSRLTNSQPLQGEIGGVSRPRPKTPSPLRVIRALAPIALAAGLGIVLASELRPPDQRGVAALVARKTDTFEGCRVWVQTDHGGALANFSHPCAKIAWSVGQPVTVDIRTYLGRSRSQIVLHDSADLRDGDPLVAD